MDGLVIHAKKVRKEENIRNQNKKNNSQNICLTHYICELLNIPSRCSKITKRRNSYCDKCTNFPKYYTKEQIDYYCQEYDTCTKILTDTSRCTRKHQLILTVNGQKHTLCKEHTCYICEENYMKTMKKWINQFKTYIMCMNRLNMVYPKDIRKLLFQQMNTYEFYNKKCFQHDKDIVNYINSKYVECCYSRISKCGKHKNNKKCKIYINEKYYQHHRNNCESFPCPCGIQMESKYLCPKCHSFSKAIHAKMFLNKN